MAVAAWEMLEKIEMLFKILIYKNAAKNASITRRDHGEGQEMQVYYILLSALRTAPAASNSIAIIEFRSNVQLHLLEPSLCRHDYQHYDADNNNNRDNNTALLTSYGFL